MSNGSYGPPAYNDNTTSTAYNEDSAAESLAGRFVNLKLQDLVSDDDFPTPGQAIAHIELLVAFSNLRDEIMKNDGLFDLWNNDATAKTSVEEIQEKRWAVFVTTAVDRFSVWWRALAMIADGPTLTVHDTRKFQRGAYLKRYYEERGKPMVQNRAELPPLGKFASGRPVCEVHQLISVLDMLMVWHAFKLNPRCYFEDCIRAGLIGVSRPKGRCQYKLTLSRPPLVTLSMDSYPREH